MEISDPTIYQPTGEGGDPDANKLQKLRYGVVIFNMYGSEQLL
jgi:hypothetical protein